jgi:hypothetical protein
MIIRNVAKDGLLTHENAVVSDARVLMIVRTLHAAV